MALRCTIQLGQIREMGGKLSVRRSLVTRTVVGHAAYESAATSKATLRDLAHDSSSYFFGCRPPDAT
jgi:hypothetical protein